MLPGVDSSWYRSRSPIFASTSSSPPCLGTLHDCHGRLTVEPWVVVEQTMLREGMLDPAIPTSSNKPGVRLFALDFADLSYHAPTYMYKIKQIRAHSPSWASENGRTRQVKQPAGGTLGTRRAQSTSSPSPYWRKRTASALEL